MPEWSDALKKIPVNPILMHLFSIFFASFFRRYITPVTPIKTGIINKAK